MPWEPAESDIQWCSSLLDCVKDGGIWGAPCCQCIYRIDKQAKRLVLVSGSDLEETHRRIVICFGRLGWSVTKEAPNEP